MSMHAVQVVFLVICASCLALPQRNNYPDDERRPGQQFLKFSAQDVKNSGFKPQRGFLASPPTNQIPPSFHSTASPLHHDSESSEEERDSAPAPAQQLRRPAFEDNYPNLIPQLRQPQPQQLFRRPNQQSPQQFRKPNEGDKESEEELDEPDRLSQLLPNSKFDCSGKNTGYYADEGLQCEVFHYCQEGTKHSWVCPEGFTFHQVHLICMPPTGDNICQKSSDYHFINEYLYKPLNLEEAESKPNVTLRYSDRFYPENFHYTADQDEEYHQTRRPQPVQIQFRRPPPSSSPQQNYAPATHGQQLQFRPSNQVFHSPEEVNISLQQRRPLLIAAQKSDFNLPAGFNFQK